MTLDQLHKNESALIDFVDNESENHYLLEMGCLPGNKVTMKHKALFNDPLAVAISGFQVMLRKSEAKKIHIKPFDTCETKHLIDLVVHMNG